MSLPEVPMRAVAFVDIENLGRFNEDYRRYCELFPGRDGPELELLGVVVGREPWRFEAVTVMENRLGARWSIALSGVWSLCAVPDELDADAAIEALSGLPAPFDRGVFVVPGRRPEVEAPPAARRAAAPARRLLTLAGDRP